MDLGLAQAKRAFEVTLSLTKRCTGLKAGFLNLSSPWKLTGWGIADSIASELSEFAALYWCRLRTGGDLVLLAWKASNQLRVGSHSRRASPVLST